MIEKKKAVLLMSGGLDSSTVLEIAKSQGFEIYALSFNYGQRHSMELKALQKVLQRSPVKVHKEISLDLRAFGGSALTDEIAVPKDGEGLAGKVIPVTYVPARNTIFLSLALGFAETVGAFDIFFGANAIDYSNYPDCRPEFVESFERMANLGTGAAQKGRGSLPDPCPSDEADQS